MTWDWVKPVLLHALSKGPIDIRLEPDAVTCAGIAKALDLESLSGFVADLTLRPWMDGVEVTGRVRATVGQICSVSLDAFEQVAEGDVDLRAVPAGSPHAPQAPGGEIEFDPEAPDPPDVLDGESIDVAGLAIEHLALAIDPFPRKPGAVFDYTPPAAEISPFAVLKALKDRGT